MYFINIDGLSAKNVKVLTVFGYIISLFPEKFYFNSNSNSQDDYKLYSNIGKQILEQAHKLDKTLKITEALYFGSILNKTNEINKEDLKIEINNNFSSNTEVEKYFDEILSNN